jgi:hypothetical protein
MLYKYDDWHCPLSDTSSDSGAGSTSVIRWFAAIILRGIFYFTISGDDWDRTWDLSEYKSSTNMQPQKWDFMDKKHAQKFVNEKFSKY